MTRPFAIRTPWGEPLDRKSTRLNSSHLVISYAVFCLKKKKKIHVSVRRHPLPGLTHDQEAPLSKEGELSKPLVGAGQIVYYHVDQLAARVHVAPIVAK